MNITVTAKHMELNDQIHAQVDRGIEKLTRVFDGLIEAKCILSAEKHRHECEISLKVFRVTLHSRHQADEVMSAIDGAMEKLHRQLKRYKAKLKDKTRPVAPVESRVDVIAPHFHDAEEAEIRHKVLDSGSYDLSAMALDEAVMQMEHQGEDLLVFTNEETLRINVVYKRKDGNIGLIDTAG